MGELFQEYNHNFYLRIILGSYNYLFVEHWSYGVWRISVILLFWTGKQGINGCFRKKTIPSEVQYNNRERCFWQVATNLCKPHGEKTLDLLFQNSPEVETIMKQNRSIR